MPVWGLCPYDTTDRAQTQYPFLFCVRRPGSLAVGSLSWRECACDLSPDYPRSVTRAPHNWATMQTGYILNCAGRNHSPRPKLM